MFDAGSAAVVLTGVVVREPFQNYGRLIAEAESHKEHRIALGARTDSAGFTKFNTELEGVQRSLRQTVASAKGSWDEIASATTRMTAATDRDLANMRRSLGLTADGYGRLGGASRGVADEVARANERMGAAAHARARAENAAADESVRADKKVAAAAGGAGRAGGGGGRINRTAVRDAENQAKQISEAYSRGFNRLANLGKWAAAGILGVGAISVKVAADFDRHMELVRTQAGASQREVDNLKKSVLALAPAVGFGPKELADGLYRIESHGIRGAQAISTLKIAAEGAKIGMAGLDETSTALVGVMQSAPKDIKGTVGSLEQAKNVMATLNDIVGRGNLHMKDLEAALGSGIVPAAKAVGLGLKDVGAALDVMTSRAIPAREGATRLRTVLSLIANPTNKAQKALDELGFAHDRLALDFRKKGLVGALQDLQNSMNNIFGRKLDPHERAQAMADYAARLKDTGVSAKATQRALHQFSEQLDKNGEGAIHSSQLIAEAFGGARMGTTMQILMQNVDDVRKHFNQLNQAGAANRFQQDWEATKKQFSVQASQMWAAVQVLGIKIGEFLIPKVKSLVNWLIEAGKWFGHHKVLLHDLEILFGTVLVAAIAAFFARLAKGIAGGIADIGRMGKALYDLPLRMTAAGREVLAEQARMKKGIDAVTESLMRQGQVAGEVGAAGAEAGAARGAGGFALGPLEGMIHGIDGTMAPGAKLNPIAVFVVDPGGLGGGGLPGGKGGGSLATKEAQTAEKAVIQEAEGPAGRTLLSKIGSFATTALRGVMRGGMLAIGGMFLTDIIASQFHGGAHKAISEIGRDASIGAGLGAIFGPPGIAGGAIIGGLVGTMRTFIHDHAADEGKQWAERFSGPLKGLLPAQVQQNLAQNLRQHLTKAFSLQELMQQQAGEGGVDQSTWKKWFNEMYRAGKTAADQFQRAFAQARYKGTPNFLDAAKKELSSLPPEARKWAALSMVQYADQLVKQGKLPKGATQQIIRSLEQTWGGLTPFLQAHAAGSARAVAAAFKFTQARNNVIGWLSGLRKQFVLLNVDPDITGKNWSANYKTTIDDLRRYAHDKSPGISGPALAALKHLLHQGKLYLEALRGEFKAALPDMARDIRDKIPGAMSHAEGAFATFKTKLDELVIAGVIKGKQRADILSGSIDELIRKLGHLSRLKKVSVEIGLSLGVATASLTQGVKNLLGLPTRQAGGPVTDATHRGFLHGMVPGSPHKDGTLAMLAGHEFVLTDDGQRIMEQHNPGLLAYIQQHQKKHFQAGGPVTQGALARGPRTSAAVSIHVDDSMQRDVKSTGTKAMTELSNAIKNGARKVQDEAKKPASAVEKLFNDHIKTKVPQLAKQGMDIVDKRFHDVKYDDYTKQTTDTVTKAWNKLKTDATQITKDTTNRVDKNWKDLRDNVVNKYAPDMTKSVRTESDKQQKKVTDSTNKAKNDGSSNWEKLANNTGKRFDEMSSHVDKKSQAMLTSVKNKTSDADKQGQSNIDKLETAIYGAIDAGVNVTAGGIGKIAKDLNAGLKVFGGGHVSIPKLDSSVGHNPLHHEVGGILPGREFGLRDNMTLVDPMGRPRAKMAGDEAVFTRQQQPYVDRGLRAIGIGGMHGLWSKVNVKHSAGVASRPPGHETGGQLRELATGGYIFPFPPGTNLGRTDQGVDATMPEGAPIGPIGPAAVKGTIPNWYTNQPLMWWQLTGGPRAGRYVYLAEHITGLASGNVPANKAVARFGGPGQASIEMGWATSSGQTAASAAGHVAAGSHYSPEGADFRNFIMGLAHGVITGGLGAFGSPISWTDLKTPGVKGTGAVADSVRAVLKKATDAANKYGQKKANMSSLSGFSGGGNNTQNEALGHKMMLAAGWPESQWASLLALWTQESNWSTTANNPSSGAYGIPQSLPGSKMASAGSDWRTNPATQIKWGLNYIRSRYGSPSGAEAHERSHNWYDQGGLLDLPEFATGGTVVRGRVSWFNDHNTAGGPPADTTAGLSLRIPGTTPGDHRNRNLLHHLFKLNVRGRTGTFPDIDLGPAVSTNRNIDVSVPALRHLGFTTSNFPTDAVGTATEIGGRASQADTNRLKRKPKKDKPKKPTPLPNLHTPPGFDPTAINALTADTALVEKLRGWQGYLTSLHSTGPQLTPLVESQDDQGNTTYTINWDGMADPTTSEPLKGINARLAEIGVNPGVDPPPAEMINRRDYTTELGIENMIIDALVKEQTDAVGANATFWTWLASMKARGDLPASAPGGPDLDTKQINWLTDALKLELPVEKMGNLFKDLGSMVIGTKTVLEYGDDPDAKRPNWDSKWGDVVGRHKVTVTKPWSTVIVEKMKDYRDAAAKVARLKALKDLIPRERRKRLENIAADYRRRAASIRGSSLRRRFTAGEMEHWALSDIKRHRKEALARIPTHAPHDWKGTKKGWKEQEKEERRIVNEEFDVDEARIHQHARQVGLQTQLDRAKALENARTQEHTEQEVVREKYEDKIHDFNSQIKAINTNRDMGKKWLNDLKGAITGDRTQVKQEISDAKDLTQNLPDLVDPLGSLSLDLLSQRTIPTEPNLAGYLDPTVGEIFTLKGTHPPKADKKDAGQTAEDIAALALADFQAFQQSQAELFTQFGSNYEPRGGNPFAGNPGISPGFQFFGAAGSDLAGNTTTNSNSNTTNININNTFGGGPPDAHTWAATQKFSVGALLG